MTIHTLTEKAIAVTGLPEGMTLLDAEIVTNQSVIPYGKQLMVPDGEYKSFPNYACIDLPEGNWTILGRAAELTEEDWKRVVDGVTDKHKKVYDYRTYTLKDEWTCKTATESGHSLLKAKGLYVTNPYTNLECPNQWCENGYIDQGYNEKWRCDYCQQNEDSEEEAELLTNPLILIK